MRLSEYGKQFLPYVEQAFAALDHGVEALQTAQGRCSKNVRFSVLDGALWNYILIPFSAKYPDINIHQISRDPDRQGKLMDQANLDFILTDLDLDNNNWEATYFDFTAEKLVNMSSSPPPWWWGSPRTIPCPTSAGRR